MVIYKNFNILEKIPNQIILELFTSRNQIYYPLKLNIDKKKYWISDIIIIPMNKSKSEVISSKFKILNKYDKKTDQDVIYIKEIKSEKFGPRILGEYIYKKNYKELYLQNNNEKDEMCEFKIFIKYFKIEFKEFDKFKNKKSSKENLSENIDSFDENSENEADVAFEEIQESLKEITKNKIKITDSSRNDKDNIDVYPGIIFYDGKIIIEDGI